MRQSMLPRTGSKTRHFFMTLYDCTRPFPEPLMTWPGDPVPAAEQAAAGEYTITIMSCASHSGTHIDAPSHLIEGGMTVDAIPLSTLIGPVTVIDLTGGDGPVTAGDLEDVVDQRRRRGLAVRAGDRDDLGRGLHLGPGAVGRAHRAGAADGQPRALGGTPDLVRGARSDAWRALSAP